MLHSRVYSSYLLHAIAKIRAREFLVGSAVRERTVGAAALAFSPVVCLSSASRPSLVPLFFHACYTRYKLTHASYRSHNRARLALDACGTRAVKYRPARIVTSVHGGPLFAACNCELISDINTRIHSPSGTNERTHSLCIVVRSLES